MQAPSQYFLKTPRTGFRSWSPDDLSFAIELWGDAEVSRLIGGPFSQPQIQERLAREIACMQKYNVQYWPFFSLANNDFVGCCGLRPFKPEQRIYELGFHLRPEYWNKGLAVESASAVISYAFQFLSAASLFAGHHPENLASRHVLHKLGFQYTHDELYPATGKVHHCYLLELRR
jgi:[ribosomal protein S5]-alanine N-acetyltransferase